jgi:hypothetical protein
VAVSSRDIPCLPLEDERLRSQDIAGMCPGLLTVPEPGMGDRVLEWAFPTLDLMGVVSGGGMVSFL